MFGWKWNYLYHWACNLSTAVLACPLIQTVMLRVLRVLKNKKMKPPVHLKISKKMGH
jgi:hypothetical protein